MADLQDLRLEKNRKHLFYRQILYGLVFFFYSLLIIFAFHFTREATGLDDGDGYYIIAYFLLPHHMAYLFSLLTNAFAWAFKNRWLSLVSLLLDAFAVIYLVYVCIRIWQNPDDLTLLLILVTTLPLLSFALFKMDLIKKKYQAYFSNK